MTDGSTTSTVYYIRCSHCGKLLAEIIPSYYVIKCPRCKYYNSPQGAFKMRASIVQSTLTLTGTT